MKPLGKIHLQKFAFETYRQTDGCHASRRRTLAVAD
jgi:hypothetical protein